MATGGIITAALASAVDKFRSSGDDLDKMAGRTGISTEALSELGFAAEQSGQSLETIEASVKKMQRTIGEAAAGGKEAAESLEAIGVSIEDLIGLSPDRQLERVADGLASIKDPTLRASAAIAIFGRSGTDLLPMMLNGAAGIRAFRQEARDLGLSKSVESARQAAELDDALNRLWRSIGSVVSSVGGALAGSMTTSVDAMTRIIGRVREWIKANQDAVVSASKVAFSVVGAGAVILTFGTIISGVGNILGVIRSVALWAAGGIDLLRMAVGVILVPFSLIATAGNILVGMLRALRVGAMVAAAGSILLAAAVTVTRVAVGSVRVAVVAMIGAFNLAWRAVGLLADGVAFATTAGLAIFNAGVTVASAAARGLSAAVSAVPAIFSAMTSACNTAITALAFIIDAFGLLGGVCRLAQYALTATGAAIASIATSGLVLANLAAMLSSIGAALSAVAGFAVVAVPAVLLLRSAARSTISSVGDMGSRLSSSVAAGAKAATSAASTGAKAMGTAIVGGARSAMTGIGSAFSSLASMAGQVARRVAADFSAGWSKVMADAESSWEAISAAVSAGDLKSAMSVALAMAKLEWARFAEWWQGVWAGLQPQWNAAIATAASGIGSMFANAEIGWGNLWDSVLGGVHAVLQAFDQALASANAFISAVKASLVKNYIADSQELSNVNAVISESAATDWSQASDEAVSEFLKKAEAVGISSTNDAAGGGKMPGETDRNYATRVGNFGGYLPREIAKSKILENAQPAPTNLAGMVPTRTGEQKAAQDEEARQRGQAVTGGISGAMSSPVVSPDGSAADRITALEAELAAAQQAALNAAKTAEDAKAAKQKDAVAQAAKGAGSTDASGERAQQAVTTAGTFSARAAVSMGGENIQQRILNEAKEAKSQRISLQKTNEMMLGEVRNLKFQFTA